jgi:membrane associated rhomboid family serine protease
MFIPFGTDRTPKQSPVITPAIVVINMAVFAIVLVFARESGQGIEQTIDMGAFDSTRPWRIWTFLTCLFLHDPNDVFHVIFNMIFLWVFGCAVEDRMGRIGFTIFYLCGGFASVLVQWAASAIQGDPTSMIGASGAVMAVTGAFVALFPRARVRMLFFLILIGVVWVPAMVVVGIFFALDVLGQMTDFLGMGSSNTAYFAHIGGSLFGFGTAFMLLMTGILKHDDFDIFYLFKQSRRRAEMRAAVAGTAGGPWASASADTGRRLAANMKKRKATPEEPPEIRHARADIARLIREHDQPEAARRYASILKEHPEITLPAEQQLDVASTFFAQESFSEAAQAYELYLKRFKSERRRTETALLLAVLYVRKAPNPTRAREILDELEPVVRDPGHQRLVTELRGELDP